MAKIGTLESFDSQYIEKRLGVVKKLSQFGRVFIDTSPIYGTGFSERMLSKVLKDEPEKFFIATKYYPQSDHSEIDLIKSVNESMDRMHIKHLDLIQIHWPNPEANLRRILNGFLQLRSEGLVSNLGVCNYSTREILQLEEEVPEIQILSNQTELNIGNMYSELNDLLSIGIKQIAYGSILQGRLTFSQQQRMAIINFAELNKISPAATALAVIFYNFNQILPVLKISSERHLLEFMDVLTSRNDLSGLNLELSGMSGGVSYIDPSQVLLTGDSFRKPYLTIEEAKKNSLDLFPSPVSLSERISKYNLVLPVKVVRNSKQSFSIDPYDPFDQIKKYWAWQISYPNEPIPVQIFENV